MKNQIFAVVFAALLTQGCVKKEESHPQSPKSFSDIAQSANDVYPLATGGAYLVAEFDGETQVYYLSGASSERVSVPSNAEKANIYPLADGDAYLVLAPDAKTRIYHLVGTTATLVTAGLAESFSAIKKPLSHRLPWVSAQTLRTQQERDDRRDREDQQNDD